MDTKKTKSYYKKLSQHDLCDCAYCQNYAHEIRTTYPELTEYLSLLGVDIEKPFETMPLAPDEPATLSTRFCISFVVKLMILQKRQLVL